jgi:hypothetical protein
MNESKDMTVADLVMKLSEYPSDMPIFIKGSFGEEWEPLWGDDLVIMKPWPDNDEAICIGG